MSVLKCPVCGGSLTENEQGRGLVCPRQHTFDRARQGYVNLLTPDKRGSGEPGDSREMVNARTRFLEGGFYEPFSDGVNRVLCELFGSREEPVRLADAGCGEGYYTLRLAKALAQRGCTPEIYGFDLSKTACAHGAVAARGVGGQVRFFVSSLFEMPLADGCCDGVVNLFAPCAEEEFARVLKPGGYFLEAVPAERHLWEMKEAMYDVPYENKVRRDTFRLFRPVEVFPIRYTFTPGERREDLLAMTPYYWRTSLQGKERLRAAENLTVRAEFDLLLYQKL